MKCARVRAVTRVRTSIAAVGGGVSLNPVEEVEEHVGAHAVGEDDHLPAVVGVVGQLDHVLELGEVLVPLLQALERQTPVVGRHEQVVAVIPDICTRTTARTVKLYLYI
jgi:hypothetical protein